jgi:hypothetical protein
MEKDGVKINWFNIEGGTTVLFDSVLASFSNWLIENK